MKASLPGALAALLLAAPVAAAPITGGMDISGLFRGEDAAGNVTRLRDAVALDFCADVSGPCVASDGGSGSFFVNQVTPGTIPVANGDTGTLLDIANLGATIPPIVNFLSINGLTFDLLQAAVYRRTETLGGRETDFLFINGSGIMRLAGYDDTPGTFTFSGQSDGVNLASSFSFSGAKDSLPIPVPTPAGLGLLGLGLAAIMFTRRRWI